MFDKDGKHTDDESKMVCFETIEELMDAYEEDFDITLTEYRALFERNKDWQEFRKRLMRALGKFNTPYKQAFEEMGNPENEVCPTCGKI